MTQEGRGDKGKDREGEVPIRGIYPMAMFYHTGWSTPQGGGGQSVV